ncbi:MAG: nucleoside triphosphate pyrophosphatase [Thermomicrobiales bacterium]|nr:nucleoside triphosphate pyrophosphatase [Thermomicrobiales bacterium]
MTGITDNPLEEARLVLASASPRRRELLQRLALPFVVVPAEVDETLDLGRAIGTAVASLAERKARAVAERCGSGLVIGADTVVVLDQLVLGKPRDAADAERMLHLLRGRAHEVITGLAVLDATSGCVERSAVVTSVQMRAASNDEIADYVGTGEPRDKAGGYAIQGAGGALVEAIAGCYVNVVGLPLCETAALIRRFGVSIPAQVPNCRLPSGAPCPRLNSDAG